MTNENKSHQSPQYIRTHKAICNALVNLLKEKAFEKITVQDILDEAPVTRTTFYKHYHDKYEVAEYLQQNFISMQREMVKEMEAKDFNDYQSIVIKYIQKHLDTLRALSKISTESVNIREINALYNRDVFEQKTGMSKNSVAAIVYAQAMYGFSEYAMEQDLQRIDTRLLYNEAMIEAFLALLNLETDEKLRKELYKKIEH